MAAVAIPDQAARLLAAGSRHLLRDRAIRRVRAAAWAASVAAPAVVTVHLFYHALSAETLAGVVAAIVLGAAAVLLAGRPSPREAAAFVDARFAGGCAYRTLLELQRTQAAASEAAKLAFLAWLEAHAARAQASLRAMPPPAPPRAALASAAVGIAVALALLQLPGKVPSPPATLSSGPTASFAAPVPDDGQVARPARFAPTDRARATQTAINREPQGRQSQGSPSNGSASSSAASTTPAAGTSSARSGSTPVTAPGGLAAGAARDEGPAAELARILRLSAIERPAFAAPQRGAGNEGGQFGAQVASDEVERTDPSGADVRPAELPPDVSPTTSGPEAQILIRRYLASRERRP